MGQGHPGWKVDGLAGSLIDPKDFFPTWYGDQSKVIRVETGEYLSMRDNESTVLRVNTGG